jgi:hypothetical protein
MVPTVAVALVVSSFVLAGPAWAKHKVANKPVTCGGIGGTVGVSPWTLTGCSPAGVAGTENPSGTITQAFPAAAASGLSATIQWSSNRLDPRDPAVATTISYSVISLTGHKDRCGAGKSEVEVKGTITGNTPATSEGAKGKVKMFVCEQAGTLSAQKKIKL